MKTIKLYLLLILSLSLTFVSCEKDKKSSSSSSSSTSTFFTIQDADYHNTGNLPEGSIDLIENLNINNTVINGGSSIVSFTSSQKIKTVFVSVKGKQGYYQYDFDNSNSSMLTKSSYYYELILLISQNLKEQGFVITISCVNESGDNSTSVDSEAINVIEVGTGNLQVSLSWDQLDDVDLHLMQPNGDKIYYGNRFEGAERIEFEFYCYLVNKYTSHDASKLVYTNEEDWDILDEYLEEVPYSAYESEYSAYMKDKIKGGYLDLDSNADCDIDAINNENITYEQEPAQGTYYVAVDLYRKCDLSKDGAKYSVTVNYNKQIVTISDKQIGQFNSDNEGSSDNPYEYHIIGAFTIDASGLRPVAVTNNPFEEYGYSKTLRKSYINNTKAKFLDNR